MIYDEQMHELGEKSNKLNMTSITSKSIFRNIIKGYYVLTHETNQIQKGQWYLLPDNNAHLIFYLLDKENTVVPKCVIVGPRSKHKIISRKNRRFTFICSFQPGGLSRFIDIPICQLKDRSLNSCDLLKNFSSDIFEKLTIKALQFDFLGFVKSLEFYLLSLTHFPSFSNNIAQEFYQYYLDYNTKPSLTLASKKFGYSDRQLRNLVKKHIGHSPKMVVQIARFTKSLTLIECEKSWANIAYSSGYYDQSHMIAEYHKLVGSTPQKLFS